MRRLLLFAGIIPSSFIFAQTEADYNFLVKRQFRSLVTSTNATTPGGFAGLDLSEGKATFSPAWQLEKGSVVSGKVTAGATDGIAYLFKNSNLNTNVSLGAQIDILAPERNSGFKILKKDITISQDQWDLLQEKKDSVRHRFLKDSLSIMSSQKLRDRKDKLETKYYSDIAYLATIKSSLSIVEFNAFQDFLQEQKDDIDDIDAILNDPTALRRWKREEIFDAQDQRDAAIEKFSKDKVKLTGFRLSWLTIGVQVRRDEFYRFDPMLAIQNRLIDEKYTSGQFRFGYSYFAWSKKKENIRFLNFGFEYNGKSNFQDLKTTEIIVATNYSGASDTSITTNKEYTAYIGDYMKKIDEVVLSADYYHFVNKSLALHGFSTYRMRDHMKPQLNFGIGLLHPFIDAKKEKSVINVEIFYTISDVWRITQEDLVLVDQGKLGLRFTFPVNFNQD